MNLDQLEREIEDYAATGGRRIEELTEDGRICVLKHLRAPYLERTLTAGRLFASGQEGFTWGDAVYVCPMARPLSTMMYGDVGVGGIAEMGRMRIYDAVDAVGVRYYQWWIAYQTAAYRYLTTTVHADWANRELRNMFRTRFQIDCVCFPPDEACPGYTGSDDIWLAFTHWDGCGRVAAGLSDVVTKLKWCVVAADRFEKESLGYRAELYDGLTYGHQFSRQDYVGLSKAVRAAYDNDGPVVIAGF